MARFLPLEGSYPKRLTHGAAGVFLLLGLMAFPGAVSRGQTMAPAQPGNQAPVAAKPTATPAPAPVANAKPVAPAPVTPPVPPPVPETFNRYGKIWAPTDDVAHPIRLNVQFPGVGEMKIPSQDELSVRDKLEKLATLSDDQIRAELAQWPPYAKMKLADEGQLLIRIQQFKDQRARMALDKAKELGLVNLLTPDQKVRFEKEYWDKKLQMDHELAKQFEPVLKAREQKLRDDLLHEFSTPGVVTPAPSTVPAVPLAQAKPGAAPAPAPPVPANTPAKPSAIPPIAEAKPTVSGTTTPVAH